MEIKQSAIPMEQDKAGRALLHELRNRSEVVGLVFRERDGKTTIVIQLGKRDPDLETRYQQYGGYPVDFELVTEAGFHTGDQTQRITTA